MKNYFNKELVMTKEDNEDFDNPTNFSICDNNHIDTDVKVRDHCHITGKYRNHIEIVISTLNYILKLLSCFRT